MENSNKKLPVPAGEEKKQASQPAVCRADGFEYVTDRYRARGTTSLEKDIILESEITSAPEQSNYDLVRLAILNSIRDPNGPVRKAIREHLHAHGLPC